MIGDSRPGFPAGAESSGAADLVTAPPTAPIYQLIWSVMHQQPGSQELALNIAKGWNRSNSNGLGEGTVAASVILPLAGCD